jgi:hypothetical protein
MRAGLVVAAALVALPARADRSTDDVAVYGTELVHAVVCVSTLIGSTSEWARHGTAPRMASVLAMVFGSGTAAFAGFFLFIDAAAVQGGRWVPMSLASLGLGAATVLQGVVGLFRAHVYDTEVAPVAASDGRSVTVGLTGRF